MLPNQLELQIVYLLLFFADISFSVCVQIKFREFIPSILNVARQCLASGEEDVAIIAFEIFDELIESPAPLLGDSVKSIVQFSLEVCSSQNLESNTRHQVGLDHEVHCYNLLCSCCYSCFAFLLLLAPSNRQFKSFHGWQSTNPIL